MPQRRALAEAPRDGLSARYGWKNNLEGAVLLLLEHLVRLRRLLERHVVGGELLDPEHVVFGEHAATVYDRLAPYAGRPVTAGRAVCSYGAVDRWLGGLAALLGREQAAVDHLQAAVRRNDELGCVVWRELAQRELALLAPVAADLKVDTVRDP